MHIIKLFRTIFLSLLFTSTAAIAQDLPAYYDFPNMQAHALIPTISMRFVNSDHFTVIQWDLKQGAKLFPQHKHINEQVTRVLAGNVDAHSGDNVYHLHAGDVMVFPANVVHGFVAMSDAVIYETQTPVRDDFLKPDFIERLSKLLRDNQ